MIKRILTGLAGLALAGSSFGLFFGTASAEDDDEPDCGRQGATGEGNLELPLFYGDLSPDADGGYIGGYIGYYFPLQESDSYIEAGGNSDDGGYVRGFGYVGVDFFIAIYGELTISDEPDLCVRDGRPSDLPCLLSFMLDGDSRGFC
jgi:hypothetical protein